MGIQWTYGTTSAMEVPSPPITLSHREMENVVAQLAATFIWLGM